METTKEMEFPYDYTGRIALEEKNKETVKRINQLREEQNAIHADRSKKMKEIQDEIDRLYSEMGKFDELVGKIIDINKMHAKKGEVEDSVTVEYVTVKSYKRLLSGVRLYGTRVFSYYNEKGEVYFLYDTSYNQDVLYKDVDNLIFATPEEYVSKLEYIKNRMV